MCFAILGAPRTSRQSREMSVLLTILLVGGLRLIGFVANVFGAQDTRAIYIPYIALVISLAVGLYAIGRAVVLEPPASLTQPIADLFERLAQRFAPA
jgi:lipopolysaccharide export system permease protein